MPQEMPVAILGRAAAACWLAAGLLLLRMATNGSFVVLAVDDTSTGGAFVALFSGAVAVLALLLAGSLVRWPHRRPLAISAGAGLLLTPLALPLLAVNHASAIALPPLGLLATLISMRAGRGLDRPAGG